MSGSGRMNLRLTSSYREDDLRRSADRRRRQATTTATPEPVAVSPHPNRPTVRVAREAIRRLVPRFG